MKRLRYLLVAAVCLSCITLLGASPIGAQDQVTVTIWHTYNEVGPETQMLTETLIPAFEASNTRTSRSKRSPTLTTVSARRC